MIYAYIPRTRFGKKKYNSSDAEVVSELAQELYYDESWDVDLLEPRAVDFIDDYSNDVYEGTFYSPPFKNSIYGIFKAEQGGGFDEALGKM